METRRRNLRTARIGAWFRQACAASPDGSPVLVSSEENDQRFYVIDGVRDDGTLSLRRVAKRGRTVNLFGIYAPQTEILVGFATKPAGDPDRQRWQVLGELLTDGAYAYILERCRTTDADPVNRDARTEYRIGRKPDRDPFVRFITNGDPEHVRRRASEINREWDRRELNKRRGNDLRRATFDNRLAKEPDPSYGTDRTDLSRWMTREGITDADARRDAYVMWGELRLVRSFDEIKELILARHGKAR